MGTFNIRNALPSDLPALPQIEKAAAQQFLSVGMGAAAAAPVTGLPSLRTALNLGLLWVIVDEHDHPVGFAYARPLDGELYLAEMDVLPEFSRRGLGALLVERVCQDALSKGYSSITLSTYRDIPWNAPFYARHGFEPIPDDELTPGLREIQEHEAQLGLMIASRVAMRKDLS